MKFFSLKQYLCQTGIPAALIVLPLNGADCDVQVNGTNSIMFGQLCEDMSSSDQYKWTMVENTRMSDQLKKQYYAVIWLTCDASCQIFLLIVLEVSSEN